MKILITSLLLVCAILGIKLAHADFATDGVSGFMQHWSNYNAFMADAAQENAGMQNDLNDNSQVANDILKANPQLNAEVVYIKNQQGNAQVNLP